jgi:ABC-2 type transport system ATP-binding protein
MSEMALTADHLIVIGRGRLIADLSVADLVARSTTSVRVRTPRTAELRLALAGEDVSITTGTDGALDVVGLTLPQIGDRAFTAGVPVHELTLQQASLEQAYMDLTADAVEYSGATTTTPTTTTAPATPDQPKSRAA